MENTAQRVIDIIAERILINKDRLVPSASFKEDLEIDSLDLTEVMEAIESEFHVTISDDQMEKMKTIGQVIEYIEQHVKH